MRNFPFLRRLIETLACAGLIPAFWLLFCSLNTFGLVALEEAKTFFFNYWVLLDETLKVAVERDPFLFMAISVIAFMAIVPTARHKLANWFSANKAPACWSVAAVVMLYNITQQTGILEKVISGAGAALFIWFALGERHRLSIVWYVFGARAFIREAFRRRFPRT